MISPLFLGDNGSFSTVGASYDYNDELNISGKMISYIFTD